MKQQQANSRRHCNSIARSCCHVVANDKRRRRRGKRFVIDLLTTTAISLLILATAVVTGFTVVVNHHRRRRTILPHDSSCSSSRLYLEKNDNNNDNNNSRQKQQQKKTTDNDNDPVLSEMDARVLQSILQDETKLDLNVEANMKKLLERGIKKDIQQPTQTDDSDSAYYSSAVFKKLTDLKLWKAVKRNASDWVESARLFVLNRVERDTKLLAMVGIYAWERAVNDVARALPSSRSTTRSSFLLTNTTTKTNDILNELKTVSSNVKDILDGNNDDNRPRGLRTVAPAGQAANAERQRRAYRRKKEGVLKEEKTVVDVRRVATGILDSAWEIKGELESETYVPGARTDNVIKKSLLQASADNKLLQGVQTMLQSETAKTALGEVTQQQQQLMQAKQPVENVEQTNAVDASTTESTQTSTEQQQPKKKKILFGFVNAVKETVNESIANQQKKRMKQQQETSSTEFANVEIEKEQQRREDTVRQPSMQQQQQQVPQQPQQQQPQPQQQQQQQQQPEQQQQQQTQQQPQQQQQQQPQQQQVTVSTSAPSQPMDAVQVEQEQVLMQKDEQEIIIDEEVELIKELLEEEDLVVERLTHCIDRPDETWLQHETVSTFVKDEFVAHMILIRRELIDHNNKWKNPNLQEIVRHLRGVKQFVHELRASAADRVSFRASQNLAFELYGIDGERDPVLLRLDDLEQTATRIANEHAKQQQEQSVDNIPFFSQVIQERKQQANNVIVKETVPYVEDSGTVIDTFSSTQKDVPPQKATTRTTVAETTPVQEPPKTAASVVVPEVVVVETAETTTTTSAFTETLSNETKTKTFVAEVVTDEDFVNAKTVQAVDDDEEALAKEKQEKLENAILSVSLRALDIVVFAIERALTVGIPRIVTVGSTAISRVESVMSKGLGSKGWKRIRNANDGSKRY